MSQGGVPGGGVVKLIRQIPSVECKFWDTALVTPTTAPGVWQNIGDAAMLSGIVQGTGPSERVGRKIKVIGIIVRLAYTCNLVGPVTFDLVRDKQCNGATATAAQIYTDPAHWGTLPNPFEETRFQFLKRKENLNLAYGAPAVTSTGISFQQKCNMVVEYNATTGAVSDLTSDNLLLFCVVGDASIGVMTPNGKGFVRILYTDA